MNNKKSYLSTYIFILSVFCFVLFIALNSDDEININDKRINNIQSQKNNPVYEIKENKPLNDISEDLSKSNENHKNDSPVEIINSIEQLNETIFLNDNDLSLKNNFNEQLDETVFLDNKIIVNKIIITKSIDDDKSSATYREPINSYKTITTLDQNVIKNITYHPIFYVWTSINTEDIDINNNEPPKLSINVKYNDTQFTNFDFDITAKTPRWREWIEIDLSNIESKKYNGLWSVEIINKKDNSIIESRVFRFNKTERNNQLSKI